MEWISDKVIRWFLFSTVCFWGCSPSPGGGQGERRITFESGDTARNAAYTWQASCRPLDTLVDWCYRYTGTQPPSELRRVARQIQDSVPQVGSLYFFAQAYLINSYFFEGNVEKMLELLDQTEAMPALKQFPFEQLRLKYVRINLYQSLERYDDVLRVSGDILKIRPVTPEQVLGLKGVFNGTLLQLVTAYIRACRQEDGFRFLRNLQQSDHPVLTEYCWRDLAVMTAYMAFKAGLTDTARVRMEAALQLPLQGDTVSNLARDYCYAADIYSHSAGGTEQAVRYWKQALELVSERDPLEIMPWAQANLGELYSREGRFHEAVEAQYEALQVYEQWNDRAGLSYTYSLLADLHTFWQYYVLAEGYISRALALAAEAKDYDSRGKALLARYRLLKAENESDSLLPVLQRAEAAFALAGNRVGQLEAQAWKGVELTEEKVSRREGIAVLRQVTADPVAGELKRYALFRSALGWGLLRQGKAAEGLPLLKEAVCRMEETGQEADLLAGYAFLKKYYAASAGCRDFAEVCRRYDALKDTLFNRQKMQAVARARIEYETEKKEQANRLLQVELKLRERTLQYYISYGVILLLAAVLLVLWLWGRHRSLRLKQKIIRLQLEEQEKQMYSLLEAQQQLNRKNEELRRDIERVLQTQQQSGGESPELEALMCTLSPRLLTEEEEASFRQAFQRLHPGFLAALRQRYPSVTRNEELLCILIYLGFSSDDTALALGILRDSVNKSRYRIRKKLGLSRDEDLNTWVTDC